ncbi:IS1380 family transposase [Frankia sp. CIT1]|uniref:IS1380 family transposase n=1 Tax=Frankia sp. CIT1 TaxID=2880974 RepID=UPI001EF55EBB|nr:IS1380 family transposase [Frankia sp. CIT1]
MKSTQWSNGMYATVGGQGITSRAGTAGARMLMDKVGMPAAITAALAGTTAYPGHDRGRVVTDLAVTIADGGTRLDDVNALADQGELFGPVASVATGWRVLAETSGRLGEIAAARAEVRAHVWEQIAARHGAIPPSTVAGTDLGDVVVLRVDATIVIAHSDKEGAAGTFTKTYGHHLLTAWCDNTGECLVLKLRPGNAGSNTADDHIEVIKDAIAQLPETHRGKLLITVDGAGSSHALVRFLDRLGNDPGHPERTVYYAVGFDVDDRVRSVVGEVPETVWAAAVRTDGEPRRNGQVAELTGLLREGPDGDRYRNWPKTLRLIARRERPAPGAQLSLFEQHAGFRFQVTATNLPTGHQVPFLEAVHRLQARVEAFIRRGKDTGLRRLPSKKKTINLGWCVAVAMACDLLAWLRLLTLDGELAKAEPKTLRYRVLHVAARIIRSGRRREIRIPETWPWAHQIAAMVDRIQALPARA